MKNLLFPFLAVLILSTCSENKSAIDDKEMQSTEDVQRFDWIIGNWIRIDEDADKMTYEKWVIITPFHYVGEALTLDKVSQDTLFEEKLALIYKENQWSLSVQSPNDIDSTVFVVTNYDDMSFSSYNAQNDFPKTIGYRIDADTLKAHIADSTTRIPFTYVRNK